MELNLEEKNKKLLEATELMKKISNSSRLAILCTLEKSSMCVGDIVKHLPHISQPMISQHLAVLKANKIVADKKNGQYVVYKISDERIKKLMIAMRDIFC